MAKELLANVRDYVEITSENLLKLRFLVKTLLVLYVLSESHIYLRSTSAVYITMT